SGFSFSERWIPLTSPTKHRCNCRIRMTMKAPDPLPVDEDVEEPPSEGTIARDLNPTHYAAKRTRVVQGKVLGRAIVPKGDGAWLPTEPARKFRAMAMGEQKLQQRPAFGF